MKQRATRVGVVGWFGSDNLGDELLLAATLKLFRRRLGGATQFTVFCPNPKRVNEIHQIDAAEMPIFRSQDRGGTRAMLSRQVVFLRELTRCRVLIFGPGTIFQEQSPVLPKPGTLPLLVRMALAAAVCRRPVATVGIGVREGVTRTGRRMLQIFEKVSSTMSVRDVHTQAYFVGKAVVTGDTACMVYGEFEARSQKRPAIAVSLRPGVQAETASLEGLVTRLADLFGSTLLVPMSHGTGAVGEDDRSLLPSEGPPRRVDILGSPLDCPHEFERATGAWMRSISGCEGAVCMRLHAAFFAVLMGVPTVAIAYEAKVRSVFDALGLSRYVVEPDTDIEYIARLLSVAIDDKRSFSAARDVIEMWKQQTERYVDDLATRMRL